ncbi:sorbitol utilization protein sou2 [Phaffia rhodozyma]|uniref:Sorbitol utilization protein sou2 n=1 Tax=Phaffia rhodozyma TaxID=264483 RepID=A0A0F7SK71_PHARH|nr:sorbitol utilization protein sou2 [Phaffia rhodozyma]
MTDRTTSDYQRKPDPVQSYSVKDLFSLKGKTAIISGGGSGIGLAVSQGYAESGANVAIIYNSSPSAIDRAKEISEEYGVRVEAYKCNVGDYDSIKETFAKIAKDFGQYDIVVANSGVQQTTPALVMSPKQYRDIMDVNLDGVFFQCQIAGQYFKENKIEGNIIVTASMSGHIVNVPQSQSIYNAAKAGCIHLVRSLAVEYSAFNVRVNSISPGYINTPASGDYDAMKPVWYEKTPMGRDSDTREMKGVYIFLASSASSYVTGTDIIIDGGYCCL